MRIRNDVACKAFEGVENESLVATPHMFYHFASGMGNPEYAQVCDFSLYFIS